MKKISLAIAVASILSSGAAFAHESGHWKDSSGNVVKSGNGDCLHTIHHKGGEGCGAGSSASTNQVITVDPNAEAAARAAAAKAAAAAAALKAKLAAEKKALKATVKEKKAALAAVKNISLKSDASFSTGGAKLSSAGKRELDRVYGKLKTLGASVSSMTVVGHADSRGKASFNQRLSEKRANAVKAYLVSKGFDGSKVKTKGMGESQPIASNDTAAGRAKNRRVNISVDGSIK